MAYGRVKSLLRYSFPLNNGRFLTFTPIGLFQIREIIVLKIVSCHYMEVYWNDFYKSGLANSVAELRQPSGFAKFTYDFVSFPRLIIDLGAGNGRDSLFFLEQGSKVISIDYSDSAFSLIENNNNSNLMKCHLDLSDSKSAEKLAIARNDFVEGVNFRALYYARFFLHAIEFSKQTQILRNLSSIVQSGDILAFENRTEDQNFYHFVNHNRYPISNLDILNAVHEFGYLTLLNIEDYGLAPFQDEDPKIGRLVIEKI